MRAIRNKTALVLFFAGLIIAINQAYSQSYQPGAAQHGSAINGDASPENRDFSSPVPAESSPPASATPAPESAGLIIRATFDASITTRPNAAAIEAAVNRAIAFYQFLFRDPVTVSILFRYAATEPDGTPISGNFVSRSNYVIYHIPWNTYLAQLRADARTGYDSSADASLPPSPLSANIVLTSANGRAVALDTPAAMFANGAVASGGPFDGIVTVSPNKPVQFTRPVAAGAYDGQRFIEHEIDEVLGLGSYLDEGTTIFVRKTCLAG